ncbi:MAG: transposase [Desulfuromonadaceae bacterium]|nr:transposase [Desulfuromonadaceae bacterium]MDD2849180.1 transposase [Desulfuromonadaceae bacterium]MDD4129771.1 transposase [Desulfuromonadaceae bacterium]
MSRPLRITYPGAFYHVTTRGNERGNIFKSRRDREKFLSYLESATIRYGAKIQAYCLMSNHFHLFLETPQGNLSEIMQHINGAYTTYFNLKRKRVGHLFQGRFKAILVEADEYAVELSRYIHLNPVRAGMASKPEEYPWSSYHAYIGNTAAPEWLNTDFILGSFTGSADNARKKYQLFVEDLIGKKHESPLKSTFGSSILGSGSFIEAITQEYLSVKEPSRNLPALRQFAIQPSPEEIIKAVQDEFDGNEKLARNASIHICHKYSGAKLKDISQHFAVGESAITEASRRFILKMEQEKSLKEKVNQVKGILKI